MVRRLTAAAAAVLLLAGSGCASEAGSEAEPRPAGPARLEVVPTLGTELSASAPILPVLSLDGSLVAVAAAATEEDRSRPLVTSTDGGRTWSPTTVPDTDAGDLSTWELSNVDGLGILAGGKIGPDRFAGPPVLWVSADDGATFAAGRGLTDGVHEGEVRSVVAVDGALLALGAVLPTGAFRSVAATWTSDDRGRSWVRRDLPELGESLFANQAVASGDRLLATTAAGMVASVDLGRTWGRVDLPVGTNVGPLDLGADGEVVAVTAPASFGDGDLRDAAVSIDGGETWVRSAPLPDVPDRDGSGTTLGGPRSVRRVPDGGLVASAGTIESYDRYLPYLVRSDDDGRTWDLADVPQDCISAATIGPLAVVEGLAVAVYDCAAPQRTDLLTSIDGGRTWTRRDDAALGSRLLGWPFPSGPRDVTLLAGRGAVVHLAAG